MIKNVGDRLYPERSVGGFSRVDGTVQFYSRVQALLGPDSVVVDLGAGRGQAIVENASAYRRSLRLMKGRVRCVIGVDVDPVVLENPSVDESRLIGSDGRLPLEDASVDIIISDATFEHIDEPAQFAREIARVLKPGGWVCARTPNRWGYIGIGTNLVPNALHVRFLRVLQPHRKEIDVFPTRYRLNTGRDLARHFPDRSWRRVVYGWNAEPAYFGQSVLLWRIAQLMFRLTPPGLGATLMIFMQRI